MKGFLKQKLMFSLMIVVLIAACIAIPLSGSIIHSYAAGSSGPVTLSGSVPKAQIANAHLLRPHPIVNGEQFTIALLLAMNNQNQMNSLMKELYDSQSSQYHHWLPTGQFNALFGPTSAQVTAAKNFLAGAGLTLISGSPSPFILQAQGSLDKIETALHVSINDYSTSDGQVFFSNDTDPQVPANLKGIIVGVMGLNNVTASLSRPEYSSTSRANYGGGPGGSGLTPSQLAGIYDAAPVYTKFHDEGQGVTLGLFELSDYTHTDIGVYEKKFGLPNVPISIIHTGFGTPNNIAAAEDELDIEAQIALAPHVKRILVYEAANTFLDRTIEEFRIAFDNKADVISSSWGSCETSTPGYVVLGESIAFAQMALQGQSNFVATGDSGAFECGTGSAALQDPSAQPLVTAVGGTSLGTFDPGTNPHPTYPPLPTEVTWSGSGGGVSQTWPALPAQTGPGVNETGFSQSGFYCGQLPGILCREAPDVSIIADRNTGFAEYCTDKFCKPYGGPGWFIEGGTSLSAPLWSAIAAMKNNYNHGRLGLYTFFLYQYDSVSGYCAQFHDITAGSNGKYPAGSDYDMSTGIGTPDIYYLVKPTGYTGCPHRGGGAQGHLWLTGHDADYHCSQDGLQCHYLQVALTYAMNGSSLPVLALDHGTEVATAISDAFGGSAPTVQTVDPRSGFASLPLVSTTGTPLYSAIVVASDITCGGCDNNNGFGDTPDSDAINARTSDIATFVNDGGGVLALAGADNIAVFYNFLPTSVTGASTTSPYTLTSLGVSLGLVEGQDDNCCPTHNSFQLPGSGSPLQVAETDAAGLAETLVAQGPFTLSAYRQTPSRPGHSPNMPTNH